MEGHLGHMTRFLPRQRLTRSGLEVTPLCIGGGPMSSLPAVFGYEVPTEQALATVREALASSINWIDTGASYGRGSGERIIGLVLGELGGVPPGYIVATKADRDLGTGDFSGAQVEKSVVDSRARLGIEHLDLVYLHDPEHVDFEAATGTGGALSSLIRLKEQGAVGAIGLAGGSVPLLMKYLDVADFDVVLTHNRYSLVDRSALPLIEKARACGTTVVNAAVFGGGVLVKGLTAMPKYGYRDISPATATAVTAMERCCARHGVTLGAAALHFSMRDHRIASTVVGVSRPQRVGELVELYEAPVPDDLWGELEDLVPAEAAWLDPPARA
jgi:D-threo-aldose 1-dehydrogenase